MRVTLQGKAAAAVIDTMGAELVSFHDLLGNEYLWQGDPQYWSGQAPFLFPIVGCLRNGKVWINGEEYHMPRHGIVRKMEFRPVMANEETAMFSLRANADTQKSYPFDFSLMVTYRLSDCTLSTNLQVMNFDQKPMPFAIGGHPAFRCPVLEGETFENYMLEFDEEETLVSPLLSRETGLIDFSDTRIVLEHGKRLPLQHSLFDQDALVLSGLKSHVVRLVSRLSGRGIEMQFDDFPYLGVWSAKGDAPFVALEPWTGCATATDEGDCMEDKRGMILLPPGQSAKFTYHITIQ